VRASEQYLVLEFGFYLNQGYSGGNGVPAPLFSTTPLIITNFHMDLKPQVKVNHGMNSPASTLYTMFE